MKKSMICALWGIAGMALTHCTTYEPITSADPDRPKFLTEIGDTVDSSIVEVSGAEIEVVDTSPEGENNAWKVTCEPGALIPRVVIHEQDPKWKLSQYQYLAVDITNLGDEDLLVECRPRDRKGMTAGSGNVIPAGQKRTLRTYLSHEIYPKYLDKHFFGVFGLPGGLVRVWSDMHTDTIDKFSLVLIHPSANTSILVENIRGEGHFEFLTKKEVEHGYFPILDEFGQFRHKDWPGKTHSLEELVESKEIEARDLSQHPGLSEWNQYGGWTKGPRLEATGSFRTAKVNGKWWLVDPEGCLFWSNGISMHDIEHGTPTPVEEREHYFTDLPDPEQYPSFYGVRENVPVGYYKGRDAFAFKSYQWNLSRKYGEGWQQKFGEMAQQRLRSWGMNTFHTWANSTIPKTPYTKNIRTENIRFIEGSSGYWGKFPDPYDPGLGEAVQEGLEAVRFTIDDPYCIGYAVHNEMNWGPNNQYLAEAVLKSNASQPAKQAMLEFLQSRYSSVEALNQAWKTTLRSWDDFLEETDFDSADSEDLQAFNVLLAKQYFSVVRGAVKEIAPQKLYFGCRFNVHYYPDENPSVDWLIKIAAQYCDVVSFNRYRYTNIDLRPSDADVPVLITEFHMGALDRGMLHYTLRFAENQEHRAELYAHYVESCLDNPYIIGAHWFQFVDEPTMGRFDGENFNTGFIDCCDRPYPEMRAAARKIGASMYAKRYQK